MTASISTEDLKRRMHGAVEALKHDLAGLRTGRASTALLDPVHVEVYGANMPINQVATVSVPEPRMLSVQVWDRSNVGPVEKAIASWRAVCSSIGTFSCKYFAACSSVNSPRASFTSTSTRSARNRMKL